MTEKRSKWRWPRWLFLLAILVAITIITIGTVSFLQEAQMSLGLGRTPGAGIKGQLVNQQRFDPPPDSLLRPSQIHVALRVAEAIDSLTTKKVRTREIEAAVANIMNEHMASQSAYWWTRTQIDRSLTRRPTDHIDTVHADLLRMFRSRFDAVRKVYRDTLDRMLKP